MQRRHLLVLANSLGNLLASRRSCGVADAVNDDPIHDGGDPGDARRNDDERDGPAAPSPATGTVDVGKTILLAPRNDDERVQARREPGPALLAGRLLQQADEGGHLLIDVPHRRRSATCPTRRSTQVEIEYGLDAEGLRLDARDRPHRLASSSAAQTTSPTSTPRRRRSGRTRLPRQRQAREQAARARLRRRDDPPGCPTSESRQTGRRSTRTFSASRHRRRMTTSR